MLEQGRTDPWWGQYLENRMAWGGPRSRRKGWLWPERERQLFHHEPMGWWQRKAASKFLVAAVGCSGCSGVDSFDSLKQETVTYWERAADGVGGGVEVRVQQRILVWERAYMHILKCIQIVWMCIRWKVSYLPWSCLLVSLTEAITITGFWIVSLEIVCVYVSFCKNDSILYTLHCFLSNSVISWGPW